MSDLQKINNFLFDMDGTLYLGNQLFEGISDLFESILKKNKNFLLLTNNSSKDKSLYQEKWKNFGIQMPQEKILTSGEATVAYLQQYGKIKFVFVLGTESLKQEFINAGFIINAEKAQAVIMGYDTSLTYQNLVTTCLLIRKGLPYIATHPDINCPSENGPLPDCGAMIEMIYHSTGKRPKIIGKPEKEMVTAALNRIGSKPENTAIVGDRLYTDMEMGYRAKLTTILVLTGESTIEDLNNVEQLPDFILDSAKNIIPLL